MENITEKIKDIILNNINGMIENVLIGYIILTIFLVIFYSSKYCMDILILTAIILSLMFGYKDTFMSKK